MGMGLPVRGVLTHLAILAIGCHIALHGYQVEGELQAQGLPWEFLRLCCIGSRGNKPQNVHQLIFASGMPQLRGRQMLHPMGARLSGLPWLPAIPEGCSGPQYTQVPLAVPTGLPAFPFTHLAGEGQISSCAVQSSTPAVAQ